MKRGKYDRVVSGAVNGAVDGVVNEGRRESPCGRRATAALSLAEGRRGLCRAQPVTAPTSSKNAIRAAG
jgi:hypothetical protein